MSYRAVIRNKNLSCVYMGTFPGDNPPEHFLGNFTPCEIGGLRDTQPVLYHRGREFAGGVFLYEEVIGNFPDFTVPTLEDEIPVEKDKLTRALDLRRRPK